jgi:hypothetical protein
MLTFDDIYRAFLAISTSGGYIVGKQGRDTAQNVQVVVNQNNATVKDVKDIVNGKSEARDRRVDELTSILHKNGIEVPPQEDKGN